MKLQYRNSARLSQRTVFKRAAVVLSVVAIVTFITVFVAQNLHPEKAFAATCENAYQLNWSDTTTWDVDCGEVNASNWSVKGTTCNYYSPTYTASGPIGGPTRELAIQVRINQSGNLDNNDTAWVYSYVNGSIQDTTQFIGSSTNSVFIMTDTMYIPSGATYRVSVRLKNDKTNELWQIKNGDVTTCLKALSPLPITLISFSAATTPENLVDLKWNTQTEVNNDFFTIERSSDGRNFEYLSTVSGSGTSITPRSYKLIDEDPLDGPNYYRLLQTDYDGTVSVFKTVYAETNRVRNHAKAVSVVPNPFSGEFVLILESEKTQKAILKLVSLSGTVIHSTSLEIIEGTNRNRVILPRKPVPGTYFLQIEGSEGLNASIKVICGRD